MTTIKPAAPDDAGAYAKWLTMACQEAGLSAEQHGEEIIVRKPGASHFLTETVTVKAAEDGQLYFWWSWDKPICPAGEVTMAVRLIENVVSVPIP